MLEHHSILNAANWMSKQRPIRKGLFVEGPPPRLLGSRCRETGNVFYPMQKMNPLTHRADTMEPVELPGTGRLLTFTVVRRAVSGFECPYALGVVELDAGPKLTAQLADWQNGPLRIGMEVELVIGSIRFDPDGTVVMGPKFRVLEGPRS